VTDAIQLNKDIFLNDFALELRSLEPYSVDQELLLNGQKRVEEQSWLRPHVGECGR